MLYNYYDYLEDIEQVKDELSTKTIKEITQHINALQPYTFLGLPVVYLLDYKTRQYLFCSHNVKALTGYAHNEFLEGGLPYTIDVINKWDMKVYTENVFPQNMQFIKTATHEQNSNYIFSSNFRWQAKNKITLFVKQSNIFLDFTSHSLPRYALGSIIDLSSVKNDPLITHQIEKTTRHSENELLASNFYYPDDRKTNLSKREKEVIKLVSAGYSSKQIADRMNVSLHTVKRHRANILLKTNCKNSSELVNYALKEKLL